MKKNLRRLIIALIIIILIFSLNMIMNKSMNTEFKALSSTNQELIQNYFKLQRSEAEDPIWDDFNLTEKPVIFVDKSAWFNNAYGFNMNDLQGLNQVGTQSITTLEGTLRRFASLNPSTWFLNLSIGNFPSFDTHHTVDRYRDVFYIKYTSGDITIQNSEPNRYPTSFFMHEFTHYTIQRNWPDGSNGLPSFEVPLNAEGVALAFLQYHIYDAMITALNRNLDKAVLEQLIMDWAVIREARAQNNANFVASESYKLTLEGVATYIDRHAALRIGQKYEYLTDAAGNESHFAKVIEFVDQGKMDPSFIANGAMYYLGSVLGDVLDKVYPEWQRELNTMTIDNPITLYDQLHAYAQSSEMKGRSLSELKSMYDYDTILEIAQKVTQ